MATPGATRPLDSFGTAGTLRVGEHEHRIHRLGGMDIAALPYSLRVILENLLRHEDGERVTAAQVEALLSWGSPAAHEQAIDLSPSRIFLHDTNGVPVLVDLAAMRDAMAALGGDPAVVNPQIPAELVVDHSIIADVAGRPDALQRNTEIEYARNLERYRFLRWGQRSLRRFAVVPPGTGIMHQINLEHLARVVVAEDGWASPDVCLGTDSHTTMVNGLGVLGWGIGGIEAEAAMLGQTVTMLLPPVVGVRLGGALPEGATATDLVLTLTQLLRSHGVVGKMVELSGPGVTAIPVADRATIANMSPEMGSTGAYFPIDDETIRYLAFTGRHPDHVALVEAYAKAQGLWHEPDATPTYSEVVELDLGTVVPSLAGPRRPQDRVALTDARRSFRQALAGILAEGDGGADVVEVGDAPDAIAEIELDGTRHAIGHGTVAIAAITSCTNTSNPAVMVAAGLVARRAVERGLRAKPWVKTSLSPGSRVVTDYLDDAGLTPALEALGFHLAGYGCMTCIGASGPLVPAVEEAVRRHDLSVASVLSGNRNFEGRISPDVRMNYLASPPLVVAYALAGSMDVDLAGEPLGTADDGRPVHLADLWPTAREVQDVIAATLQPGSFSRVYADVFAGDERWQALDAPSGTTFAWDDASTYVRRPPYLDGMSPTPEAPADLVDARVLVKLGDSITTDHISPAGAIGRDTPAGRHLVERGVEPSQLNTYASRRGNHEVMMRGTFANVRLRNALVPGREGGWTRCFPDGRVTSVYDAAMAYRDAGVPLVVVAGKDYGAGSSRDWAAKGPALLGVRAVLAESFERIHRSNLLGMGILPLQLPPGETADSLGLTGDEPVTIGGMAGLAAWPLPRALPVRSGAARFEAVVRIDTEREAEHHRHGGILPHLLRRLLAA